MNAIAIDTEMTRASDGSPRALRDLNGAQAFVGSRWGEALSSGAELLRVLALHPIALARAQASLSLEMTRIALGRSRLRPAPDDRRFTHPAWQENPAFRRLLQGYLAWSSALLELVHGLRIGADQRRRLLFVAEHLVAAGAPSNLFVTHPGFYDAAAHTRGVSIIRGIRHLLEDIRTNRGLPRQVDASAFRLGRNIAATEGAIVYRNEIFELIQYSPRTAEVDAQPVLFCPPQINKYYVIDLSPEKSFVRHALEAGQQMFAISWRNPTATQSDWDLGAYVRATAEAIDIVRAICGEQPVKLMGACAGGLTAAVTLAWLAGRGEQEKVSCLSLFVTMLDSPRSRRLARVADDAAVTAALARSRFSGVLDGADMARTFAWLRPNDLIWHFVVNNYVLGNEPPAFDVLYWNTDTTRLPAALHADLLMIYRRNRLRRGSDYAIDGVNIDIAAIDRDVFVVAGARDHITPWQACYRSMQMFRTNMRFVLGSAGHVQSILCPPGDDSTRFYVNDDYSLDPAAWRRGAREQKGSWWPAWVRWAQCHGGEHVEAPIVYGNETHEALDPAPGRYVRQV
ncbi:Poly3-hydroxyalkanoic acid synthase 2 protein [Salinisphaera shabanensis E1L3A]|uniref:Poly3-hydroxyalkanoic acid synthase 2 protein n=1 Tax=Salinisphaera shabanensis E1L3A TaxID=1033802 RepID=U2E7P7_9GAMM|nr:alpha/beta fold hydrolase [Salinisphaera shabanensis]ERJ19756.1 Poly3-hydroxyalkanoic acid synthase 2 protein [Salinisphaera shabanensis E1L3A]